MRVKVLTKLLVCIRSDIIVNSVLVLICVFWSEIWSEFIATCLITLLPYEPQISALLFLFCGQFVQFQSVKVIRFRCVCIGVFLSHPISGKQFTASVSFVLACLTVTCKERSFTPDSADTIRQQVQSVEFRLLSSTGAILLRSRFVCFNKQFNAEQKVLFFARLTDDWQLTVESVAKRRGGAATSAWYEKVKFIATVK